MVDLYRKKQTADREHLTGWWHDDAGNQRITWSSKSTVAAKTQISKRTSASPLIVAA